MIIICDINEKKRKIGFLMSIMNGGGGFENACDTSAMV